MSLEKTITVNSEYTRAVQLERDFRGSTQNSYLPTTRALKTLARISDTFNSNDQPRAWSVVGPYGSGKSSLALFVASLCSFNNRNSVTRLGEYSEHLASRYEPISTLPVLISGSPEPLGRKLISGLLDALKLDESRKTVKKKKLLERLEEVAKTKTISTSTVIEMFEQAIAFQAERESQGILLIIDELGKFLEYEARHYDANDIFLLQGLAELSFKGGDANLYLMVFLHRSIDQYAQGLGESLKQEWSKIQGRFEEVPYIETPEQVLRVVSAALSQNIPKSSVRGIQEQIQHDGRSLIRALKLEGAMDVDLFQECYPLHPLTAFLLPYLCNKVSQNERTLFSYLGSEEENGFKDSLRRLTLGDFIYPWDLYDYFVSNQVGAVGDHLTHRRWIEVVTAVERADAVKEEEIQLLKCIGLFNIIASQGHVKASIDSLKVAFPKRNLQSLLKSLANKSLIVYRKFNAEYRVWQGSDFDIDAAVQQVISSLGNYSISDELNKNLNLNPLVARKYSVDSGALRYFQPIFIDANSHDQKLDLGDDPKVFFYLAFGKQDKTYFRELLKSNSDDIFVYCESPLQLKDAVLESLALSRVQIDSSDLSHDPIASREFLERLGAAQSLEKEVLGKLTTDNQTNDWYFNGKKLNLRKGVQPAISKVLQSLYPSAPIFRNELINRDRPSAQAVAARTKLMEAMLVRNDEQDLGIEKFPAEKAMYRALLKETGLHRKINGVYKFAAPPKSNPPLKAVWSQLEDFIRSTEKEAKSFVELNAVLMRAPYGIKAGMLPILYLAYYVANENELAVFESRRYCPVVSTEMLERFVKRPDDFTFQLFRIQGLKASLFKQYSNALFGDERAEGVLDIAKPLAKFMGALPEYTLKTKRGLSNDTLAMRGAFNLAKSPEHLIFESLPMALGFDVFDSRKVDDKKLVLFAGKLRNCLSDLKNCYNNLLSDEKAILAQALNQPTDESLDEIRNFAKHWYGLEKYTADGKELGAFLTRLTKIQGTAEQWLENILMFLIHKEPKSWTDSDRDEAEFRLHNLSSRALELQKIRLSETQAAESATDYEFYLLRTVKKGDIDREVVVSINDATDRRISGVQHDVERLLDSELDLDMQIALLAKLANAALEKKDATRRPSLKVIDSNEK